MDISSLINDAEVGSDVDWTSFKEQNMLQGIPDIARFTTMDDSQIRALHRIVTKELAIVQGPPGTGKTFTSVSALKVLLANRYHEEPPLIVAAQTNHALDQILLHLIGSDDITGARICRVGGRTESEQIEQHTLFRLRERTNTPIGASGFRALEGSRHTSIDKIRILADGVFNDRLLDPESLLTAGIITEAQYKSLVDDTMEQTETHENFGPFSIWLADECVESQVIRTKRAELANGDDADLQAEEFEYDGDLDNIADDEEDQDRIRGIFVRLDHIWTGKEPAHLTRWERRAEKELEKEDLFLIPKGLRGAVYQLLTARLIAKIQPEFAKLLQENVEICNKLKINKWTQNVKLIQLERIEVVGCTTTGLTKYRGLLAALQPRTMLIEEAAETREANISSALYPSIQQLILVGDHLQLTPQCDVRWLGQEPFNMNVSMFQRMVNLGVPFVMLNQQRRMIPDIRHVLSPFYPELTDHPLVSDPGKRQPIPGMGGRNAWLFTHDWAEDTDADQSKFNDQEAQMIVNFFAYLVANGMNPSHITILTFYNGQRRVLLRKLRSHGSIISESYNVFTVDSYQGEENDIVLLSMVRSPQQQTAYSVGFLDNQNRAVVAISRARCGFYLFGNMDNALRANSTSFELWGRIWNGFAEKGYVKRKHGLPLTCKNHGIITWIRHMDDWDDNAGGCNQRCGGIRPCGHPCTLKCHP
jgi:helicase required for RNAi-mediated heterochromatin assembly 1